MPGAWEIPPSVLCCILHTDNTTVAWAFGLRRLIIPGPFQEPVALAGMPFDHARNVAAMRTLESGADYCFMFDSDIVAPADAILRLIAQKKPIVSGMYCRRSPPVAVPVMIRGGQWVTQFPKNALIEVDVVGAGCLLIAREVLEKLPPQRPEAGKHWFDWRVDMQGLLPQGECLSEDFTMCIHAKRHGYQIFVDTSIQCKHIGYAESKYASFGPLDVAPV